MRVKIAIRNLIISQFIILLFLVFAWIVWFPNGLSQLGGFYKTASMLIFSDLVLGPLLVFIVFKEGKQYLTFDMNVLLAIQIGAFLFGAYSLFLKHPAYAVFKGDRFILTNVSHLYPRQHWFEQLKISFFSSPRFVLAQFPNDPKEQIQLALDIDIGGMPDIETRPDLFKPLESDLKTVLSKSIPVNDLVESGHERFLENLLKKNGGKIQDYAFFRLKGNNQKEKVWVFRREGFEPVEIIDAEPQRLKTASKNDNIPVSL